MWAASTQPSPSSSSSTSTARTLAPPPPRASPATPRAGPAGSSIATSRGVQHKFAKQNRARPTLGGVVCRAARPSSSCAGVRDAMRVGGARLTRPSVLGARVQAARASRLIHRLAVWQRGQAVPALSEVRAGQAGRRACQREFKLAAIASSWTWWPALIKPASLSLSRAEVQAASDSEHHDDDGRGLSDSELPA